MPPLSSCAESPVLMPTRIRLGMLTPSSNTALEPITAAMLGELPHVTAHFGRFKVTQIALSPNALAQFDDSAIMTAADLLADARCDVIAWNGTSSGWIGFDADERLSARIRETTNAKAATSMLGLNQALAMTGVRRLGLVTPYTADVQQKIVANYAALGIQIAAERHLNISENFAFSEVDPGQIAAMVRAVAREKPDAPPDAIAIVCTNLRAAPEVAMLEAELGIPVYDTIATVVWQSLLQAGADPSLVKGWGSVVQLMPIQHTPGPSS